MVLKFLLFRVRIGVKFKTNKKIWAQNINFEVILSKYLHELKINKCYDFISLTRKGFGTLYFREGTIEITRER